MIRVETDMAWQNIIRYPADGGKCMDNRPGRNRT